MSISLSPCKICSRHADVLAQNLTLRVHSIGPRHKGHRGGALDMMSSAHDSQAHCMRHKRSPQSAAQGRCKLNCTVMCLRGSFAARTARDVIRQGIDIVLGPQRQALSCHCLINA